MINLDNMGYIDKFTLATEIEKLKGKVSDSSSYCNGWQHALRMLEIELNTLEVKEVDLEKEINKYISDNFFGSEIMGFFATRTKEEPNDIDMALCAKHFFELGLRYKSSYVNTPNIDDTLKEMGVDPDSKEANTFKESYFKVLDKLQAKQP